MSNPIRRAIVTGAARRVIGQALPLVLAGALAACRTTVPQGGDSAAAVDPTQARYRAELAAGSGLDALATVCKANPVVTLLFAAKDPAVNQAVVLREALLERLK